MTNRLNNLVCVAFFLCLVPALAMEEFPSESEAQRQQRLFPRIVSPMPIRGLPVLSEKECENYQHPLVTLLEEEADKIAREDKEKRLAKIDSFDVLIIKPITYVAKAWYHHQIKSEATAYWKMRHIIESNLQLFLSAPSSSINDLLTTIHYSYFPTNFKQFLADYINEYYFDFHSTFWKYHSLHQGRIWLCHRLP